MNEVTWNELITTVGSNKTAMIHNDVFATSIKFDEIGLDGKGRVVFKLNGNSSSYVNLDAITKVEDHNTGLVFIRLV